MVEIRSVWNHNFEEEMVRLNTTLYNCRTIAFDTEFPGFLRDTPRDASDKQRYSDMKFNVDRMKIIQLGLTLCDDNGNVGGVWEFNFGSFDLKTDPHDPASIDFLKKSGLSFDKMIKKGVEPLVFRNMFLDLISDRRLTWVTFHGLYDAGYLVNLITDAPLPYSIPGFTLRCREIFGKMFDVKYMARFCPGLLEGELGLERLGKILKVDRLGAAHNAGSDSLLTSMVFTKMMMDFHLNEEMFEGILYLHRQDLLSTVFPPQQQVYRQPLLAYQTNCSVPLNLNAEPFYSYQCN